MQVPKAPKLRLSLTWIFIEILPLKQLLYGNLHCGRSLTPTFHPNQGMPAIQANQAACEVKNHACTLPGRDPETVKKPSPASSTLTRHWVGSELSSKPLDWTGMRYCATWENPTFTVRPAYRHLWYFSSAHFNSVKALRYATPKRLKPWQN